MFSNRPWIHHHLLVLLHKNDYIQPYKQQFMVCFSGKGGVAWKVYQMNDFSTCNALYLYLSCWMLSFQVSLALLIASQPVPLADTTWLDNEDSQKFLRFLSLWASSALSYFVSFVSSCLFLSLLLCFSIRFVVSSSTSPSSTPASSA